MPQRQGVLDGGDSEIFMHGTQLVTALAQATDADGSKRPAKIETDSATGKSFIKLPVPDPQTVQLLAGAIGKLITRLRS